MSLVWKLLKRNVSAWQIAGYVVATLVGVVIVMTAVQFYNDIGRAITGGGDDGVSIVSPRNMVISKTVGTLTTLSGKKPSFDEDDIDELRSQPWAKDVVPFQASDFNVWAEAKFGDRRMTTALFFESIPSRLIDETVEDFYFDPAAPEIPIVLSKDYLALYNFGFAATSGMPVISEDIISSIPLSVTLGGNGNYGTYPARIVGFSSWLNTIAVPQEFMDWAHSIYGGKTVERPSRLIVEVDDASSPEIERFIDEHGYEVAGPKDTSARASYMLRLVTSIVAAVGGLIIALSLFILILSMFLLVQKNHRSIAGLLLLGYSPGQVSRCYVRLVAIVNGAVMVVAAAAVVAVARLWLPALQTMGAGPTPPFAAWGVGLGLIALLTIVNIIIVRRLVAKYF